MKRNVPNDLTKMILYPLMGRGNKTESDYITSVEKFERGVEKSLIETFGKLSITSSVKTNPYSLPFNKEIKITLLGESYLNGPYEVHRVVRKIVKELLDENLYKIRFYVYVDVITDFGISGKVDYYFRYYSH